MRVKEGYVPKNMMTTIGYKPPTIMIIGACEYAHVEIMLLLTILQINIDRLHQK